MVEKDKKQVFARNRDNDNYKPPWHRFKDSEIDRHNVEIERLKNISAKDQMIDDMNANPELYKNIFDKYSKFDKFDKGKIIFKK